MSLRVRYTSLGWVLLAGALLSSVPGPSPAAAVEPGGTSAELETLSIGFSAGVLAYVDPKDAQAATKVWADMILRRRGVETASGALISPDDDAVERDLREKTVDLVLLREGILTDAATYFSSVKATRKPSQTILPVFFRLSLQYAKGK